MGKKADQREARRQRALLREEAARQAGVHPPPPRLSTRAAVAAVLETPAVQVLLRAEDIHLPGRSHRAALAERAPAGASGTSRIRRSMGSASRRKEERPQGAPGADCAARPRPRDPVALARAGCPGRAGGGGGGSELMICTRCAGDAIGPLSPCCGAPARLPVRCPPDPRLSLPTMVTRFPNCDAPWASSPVSGGS